MTDQAPKSAYEIAMERLRQKDAEQGIERKPVTEEQKSRHRRDPVCMKPSWRRRK